MTNRFPPLDGANPLAITPAFRRYVGGKQSHLPNFKKLLLPCQTYYEPFCGGAAVYCYMVSNNLAKNYVINDNNPDVVLIYQSLRDAPKEFIEEAQHYAHARDVLPINNPHQTFGKSTKRRSKFSRRSPADPEFDRRDFYYYLRDWKYPRIPSPALLYVLMQLGYDNIISNDNGEEFGYFASGCGTCIKAFSVDTDNLWRWHKALQHTTILNLDYSQIALPDDRRVLIYCDPIYRSADHYNQLTPTDQEFHQMLKHFGEYPCVFSNISDGKFFEQNRYGYQWLTFEANHHVSHRKVREIVLYKNLNYLNGLSG